MTHPHHTTKLDRDCERVVSPMDGDFLAGHRDGARGWSARDRASQPYWRGYRLGQLVREMQWLATFGEGAAV